MATLRDLSIKKKLLLITMVTILSSLLMAGASFVILDSILFRSGMERDLTALARIVADNSMAAVDFDDPKVATEVLTALKARPHLVTACILRPDGSEFARFAQTPANRQCGMPSQEENITSTSSGLVASRPIVLNNKRIGTLVISYDLQEAAERTRLEIEIVLVILLASSAIAFLLSSQLREIIATPIARLARAASAVSRTGDYSVRVEKYSRDEIGILVDAFNEMLERVQSRDIELQDARNSLETTLSSIGDAVISTDLSGRVVFANRIAQALLRRKDEDLVGQPIDQVFRISDELSRQQEEIPIYKVLREGNIVALSNHTLLTAADGTEFPIDDSAAPIRNARGEMTGFVLIFRDISNRRATEKLLEAQTVELSQRAHLLNEAAEKKDEFLAMLAHELRNPLAPIRNAARLLKLANADDESQRLAGEVIERQTQHLTRLVDDLLDVSRITRGKVTLKPERLELSTIVNRAVEASRPFIDSRHHRFTISLPGKPVYLKGDLTRLVQVVSNILNNAAKFTDTGGDIGVEAGRTNEMGEEVFIRVTDSGIGLAESAMPDIFDLFSQADRSLDRAMGGLGIGLTVARNLVELHGGRIEARSPGPGKGSEFTVILPALPALPALEELEGQGQEDPAPPTGSVRSAAAPLRILVLEDNVDSAEILALVLKAEGHDVRTAYDGPGGLEIAGEFMPQVVLCDIGLPGMNGYEVALTLRAKSEFRDIRLIALTGYGQDEDRRRSKEAGFDYHLTKPIEPDRLTELIGSAH